MPVMATFHSRAKGLLVKFSDRRRVKFHDGVAEVNDEDLALRLLDFAERHPQFQITTDDDLDFEEPDEDPEDPEDEDEDSEDGGDADPFRSPITGGH